MLADRAIAYTPRGLNGRRGEDAILSGLRRLPCYRKGERVNGPLRMVMWCRDEVQREWRTLEANLKLRATGVKYVLNKPNWLRRTLQTGRLKDLEQGNTGGYCELEIKLQQIRRQIKISSRGRLSAEDREGIDPYLGVSLGPRQILKRRSIFL